MLHVVIVEDDPLAERLLKESVAGEGVVVNALYTSGEEALEKIPALPLPEIVLMDVGLPGISGIETTRRLKEKYPQMEIVIQTIFEDSETIFQAIKGGASGYLLKASPSHEIHKALMDVAAGGSYLSARVARKVVVAFREEKMTDSKPNSTFLGLTEREGDILDELIRGRSYKKIGERLDISVHTVNNHIRKIYEKLQVNSRGEAVAKVRGHYA